jgi:hypothetical protein
MFETTQTMARVVLERVSHLREYDQLEPTGSTFTIFVFLAGALRLQSVR